MACAKWILNERGPRGGPGRGNNLAQSQGSYGKRQQNRESVAALVAASLRGEPRPIMTLGLMVLTLVPLARVAFCFLLFVKERDGIYVAFTAYVLIGLVAGVILGRVG